LVWYVGELAGDGMVWEGEGDVEGVGGGGSWFLMMFVVGAVVRLREWTSWSFEDG
jgi:hypothetical protein